MIRYGPDVWYVSEVCIFVVHTQVMLSAVHQIFTFFKATVVCVAEGREKLRDILQEVECRQSHTGKKKSTVKTEQRRPEQEILPSLMQLHISACENAALVASTAAASIAPMTAVETKGAAATPGLSYNQTIFLQTKYMERRLAERFAEGFRITDFPDVTVKYVPLTISISTRLET
mgnify:CR=1 FL=1